VADAPRLRRVVKQRTVVSTGAGLALATISYSASMELATHVLGDSAWLAILVAGIFCLMAGACFAELSGMYPTAAGIKIFVERASNEKVALLFGTVYMTVAVSVIGAETFVLASVLHDGVGLTFMPPFAWGLLFLLVIGILNICGIRIAGTFQDVVAYSMFAFIIGSSIYALAHGGFQVRMPVSIGDPGEFIKAVAVGVFLYVGFEWVTPLAEEVTDQRLISRGLMLTVGLLFCSYALFNIALTTTMTPQIRNSPEAPAYAELIDTAVATGKLGPDIDRTALTYEQAKQAFGSTSIPHVLFYGHLFGTAGILVIALMSITASVTSFNAGTLTASRYMYALARDGSLPRVLSRISIRFATPYVALAVLCGISIVISATVFLLERSRPESYEFFIYMGGFVECMIYVVMAFSLLSLRWRQPQAERPVRLPGGPAVAIVVLLFFSLLGVSILIQRPSVAVAIAIVFGASAYYGWFWVPRMRAKARAAARGRTRRRPGAGGQPTAGEQG
jgi:amino acid transporter